MASENDLIQLVKENNSEKDFAQAGKYKIIKCILNPKPILNSEYEGDILVKISWNKDDDNFIIPKSPQRRSAAQYKSGNNTTLFGSNTAISKVHTIQRENLYKYSLSFPFALKAINLKIQGNKYFPKGYTNDKQKLITVSLIK